MTDKSKELENFKDHLATDTNLVKAIGDFTTVRHGYVEIEHGLDDEGNYIWHFSPFSKTKPFPPSPKFVFEAITTYLSKVIPEDVLVDAFPPPPQWEKTVYTIKAKKIGKKWNFDEENMTKYLPVICEHISDRIDQLRGNRRIRK